jgi:hypothetical protein
MKYVAFIVCAAVAIVALSAGSTFAVVAWAGRYFREAPPASAAPLGKQGQQVPAVRVDRRLRSRPSRAPRTTATQRVPGALRPVVEARRQPLGEAGTRGTGVGA